MSAIPSIDEAGDLHNKRVLVRVDFNTPMKDGAVSDDTRLKAAMPTINALRDKQARIGLLAHFGRPDGAPDPSMSLGTVAKALEPLVGAPVVFVADCVGETAERAMMDLPAGGVALLENTRFHPGEEANDPDFAKALARCGDVYVNDAFSAAHRAHASTAGLAELLPAYAGHSMKRELDHLAAALENPEKPLLALVGGAKVSTKIELLTNLTAKTDMLVIGGGMANTFLLAMGLEVGASLCEPSLVGTAKEVLAAAEKRGCRIILPSDVVVAEKFEANAPHRVRPVGEVRSGEMILDAGPESVDAICAAIEQARTMIWNGPLGAFELEPFHTSTVETARYAAKRTADKRLVTVAGGGDTVAALNLAGVGEAFTFVSTAGGAFLEWMEGKTLPGVAALRRTGH